MPSDKDLPENIQTEEELQDELDDFDSPDANDVNEVADEDERQEETATETTTETVEETTTEEASTEQTAEEVAETEDQRADADTDERVADEQQDDADLSVEGEASTETGDRVAEYEAKLAALMDQNRALMEKINELAGAGVHPSVVKPEEAEAKPFDFEITEEEHRRLLEDPEGFKEVLGNVISRVKAESLNEARERMRMELPGLANDVWKAQNYVNTLFDSFYKKNKDLAPVKQFVVSQLAKIEAENPGKSHAEALELAGNRVRELLKIQRQAQEEADNAARKKPAFATQKGKSERGKKPDNELTTLQKEIDELGDVA